MECFSLVYNRVDIMDDMYFKLRKEERMGARLLSSIEIYEKLFSKLFDDEKLDDDIIYYIGNNIIET